jgi:hypothetical protein
MTMGAWDVGSFGNDDAADWVWQLEDAEDLTPVEEALERVFDEFKSDGYVESPTGSEAIAACEVIARLKGNFGIRDTYSETVDNWVTAHPFKPEAAMLEKANRAIDIITSEKQSELRDLFEESEQFAQWTSSVADLQKRMNS